MNNHSYCSCDAFIDEHGSVEFPVSNYFLISHGPVHFPKIFSGNNSEPTMRGSLTSQEDVEKLTLKSIFSEGSTVFEFLWKNFWNGDVEKSKNFYVGRIGNNDIVLADKRVSKVQGYFFLKQNIVYFTDMSSYGTFRNDTQMTGNVPKPLESRDELRMGPFAFTLYSAEDMFNRLVRILRE
ncbi:FHA domain-containing protein [Candidatus Woesearchaeota archaeon]|nr:FHA domain-containing protein [Candidatus Woesearchaeota archaeon]